MTVPTAKKHLGTFAGARFGRGELHALADGLPQIVWAAEADGRVVFFNRRWLEYTGLERDESFGLGWQDAVHPDDLQPALTARVHAAERCEPFELECRIRGRDGRYRRFLVRCEPMVDGSSSTRWLGSATDIEDLRSADAKRLERAESQFLAAVENVLDCLLLLLPLRDDSGVVVDFLIEYANEPACGDAGLPREDQVGRRLLDVMPHRRDDALFAACRRVAETQAPSRDDSLEFLGTDRKSHTAEVRIAPCGDGIVVAWRDVTERRRIESELRAGEERFRRLADAMPQVVWIADAEGSVVYYNDRVRSLGAIGTRPDGTWDWRPAVHPEDLAATAEHWQEAVAADLPYQQEHRLRMADGSYRWHLSRAVRVDDAGSTRWFGTATDIQDLKAAQEALREVDRRKDHFIATLAHELRNPLAAITHAAALLRSRGADPESAAWAEDAVERQAGRLARLVDDLLDVARVSTGKVRLRSERVDAAELVRGAVAVVRPTIETEGHSLVVDLPPHPLPVDGDPARLEQVLVNLLNNAAKYTDAGGRIAVSAGVEDGRAVIRVRDTGIGLDPAMLARVFELFAQHDEAEDRARGGLGIGLAVVKALVEMHDGTVSAASDGPGHGSEFSVRLPLADHPAETPESPQRLAPTHVPVQCRRVLIVDDNIDAARALARLLHRAGHDTLTADDGPSALAVAESFRPDVVLLDIGLPGMDGYEVARALRHGPAPRARIVALSGYAQAHDRPASPESGIERHLVKPVDFDVVLGVVAETPRAG